MPATRLEIDKSTILDNVDERQVEFEAEVDGDEHQFAVQYDLLEARTGDARDNDAVDTFNQFIDPISDAALSALSRDSDQPIIVVTEKTWTDSIGPLRWPERWGMILGGGEWNM